MGKMRLDALLVQKGLVSGRDKAKALIMAGDVFVDGQRETKAGTQVSEQSELVVKAEPLAYVSRGGLKLEKAVQVFNVSLTDKICMDIGASTGGFTDCMLQGGAKKVYAVDVGYGQLAWELRQNPKVVVMERTNIRYVTKEEVPEPLDFVGIDVSFISLALVLPVAYLLLKEQGQVVCLIKPQFEAGRDKVGKRGVVREKSTHRQVIEAVLATAKSLGFSMLGLDFSPITGPEGNIEYLLYLEKTAEDFSSVKDFTAAEEQKIVDTVTLAHETLVTS